MKNDELIRFGVSFPISLLEQFDQYIKEQKYTNRSEAIRDLARKAILEPSRLSPDENVAGVIIMVYNHHTSDLPIFLKDVQHDFHHDIISTMHIHLNHTQCLEVIVVRGKLGNLRSLHQQIQAQKGVSYAELSVTYLDDSSHDD